MSYHDSQVRQVYAWQNTIRHEFDEISEAVIPHLISAACEYAGIKVPRLRYNVNMQSMAHYTPSTNVITLPGTSASWAHRTDTVLHEVAHAVHRAHPDRLHHQTHGPEFMLIYLDLLDKFTSHNFKELRAGARLHGIQVDPRLTN